MLTFTTHAELQQFLPPLSAEEHRQLADNLQRDGCQEPLLVWDEARVLLDGHHRHDICLQYDIPYTVRTISLPGLDAAKAWMVRYQLGRRNLTPEQLSYLRGKQYGWAK